MGLFIPSHDIVFHILLRLQALLFHQDIHQLIHLFLRNALRMCQLYVFSDIFLVDVQQRQQAVTAALQVFILLGHDSQMIGQRFGH